jgi:uncharacterized protein YbjT (DUF2867 family)
MPSVSPILVTGAAGRVGGVGRSIVKLLRDRGLPVRALVRHEDERADPLRAMGAEVVAADLTRTEDVLAAMHGCRRVYFGMSVSPQHLEATVTVAAVAKQHRDLDVLVNISQMTVSQMSLEHQTDSRQQRLQWLGEQVLRWSGLPVVEVRPTVFVENPFFLEWAAESIKQDATLRLPFGEGRTSPVASRDVAAVMAEILASPAPHLGKVYELTGPRTLDMHEVAAEYSKALHRHVRYLDVPFEQWREHELVGHQLPSHLADHLATMARLHAQDRYNRLTHDVELVTGRPATSFSEAIAPHAALFQR